MLGMTVFVLLLIVGFALLCFWFLRQPDGYLSSQRVLTCPETRKPAAVKLDIGHRLRTLFGGREQLQLKSCSRWPERQGCSQECLLQVDSSPAILDGVLRAWYAGKTCALCHRALQEQDWTLGRFSAVDASGRFLCGSELPLRKLPTALESYQPVCWPCHLGQRARNYPPDTLLQGDRRAAKEERWTGT
jgi:hypothetical protein